MKARRARVDGDATSSRFGSFWAYPRLFTGLTGLGAKRSGRGKEANSTSGTPAAQVPVLYEVQEEKNAGLAQHVKANLCFLDRMHLSG